MSTIITAIEYYLPEFILSNEMLRNENPHWEMDRVVEKSGVSERHIAREGETAFDLAKKACDKLFEYNNKGEIDGIIFCTQSPDFIMPPNSFLLHRYLGIKDSIFAFDFNHACTGFIYSLAMAHSFLLANLAKKILIVNADTYSKYINKDDRSTRVLFGDGAAASVVEKDVDDKGIIDIELASSGRHFDKFWIQAGGMRMPKSERTSISKSDARGNVINMENIQMDGLGVFSFINTFVPRQIKDLLKRNDLVISDIDLFIFHQASKMTLDSLKKVLGLKNEQLFTNIALIGNTVSASIPIAIKDAMSQGKFKSNQLIVISGFGVGMSYGSIIMKI
jgi:3-oxoacyl-[acyl-carrier-protein] synthase III